MSYIDMLVEDLEELPLPGNDLSLAARAVKCARGKGLEYLRTTEARARCWLAGYHAAALDRQRLIEAEAENIYLRARLAQVCGICGKSPDDHGRKIVSHNFESLL